LIYLHIFSTTDSLAASHCKALTLAQKFANRKAVNASTNMDKYHVHSIVRVSFKRKEILLIFQKARSREQDSTKHIQYFFSRFSPTNYAELLWQKFQHNIRFVAILCIFWFYNSKTNFIWSFFNAFHRCLSNLKITPTLKNV